MDEREMISEGRFLTRRRFLAAMGAPALGVLGGGQAEAGRVKSVVIDAGHGGHDKGASYGLVYEKHLNLDVAFRLEAYLRKRGIKTVQTRSRDVFISLGQRCRTANANSRAVFVSIHFNWTWKKSSAGLETFYYSGNAYSLGRHVHSRMIGALRGTDRGLKRRGFYVLRHTRIPAILVEGGFISNSTERNRCLQPWYRETLAQAIGEAVLKVRT
ncbi:MAG: N-acetylmuramoyl-L-alanine amidase [Verrucomicrobiota bacterium]